MVFKNNTEKGNLAEIENARIDVREANSLERIDSLDYLRGIAAISVMFFHYYSWTISGLDPVGFMNKIGLYAVSVFYVLSGLTLYIVYVKNKHLSFLNLKIFFTKRFFRIYPLLWLVIFLYLFLIKEPYLIGTIALNLSGLFGIVAWGNYIGTGVWSIGNELAFYTLFPVLWYAVSRKKFLITIITTFLIFVWFAFIYLDADKILNGDQWQIYVNPLNQVFLFVAGMAIGRYMKGLLNHRMAIVLLCFLCLSFIFYPASGKNLVTGVDRIVLSFLAIGLCFSIFQLSKISNQNIHNILKWLGECSYSIYLIHPIVFHVLFTQNTFYSLPVKVLLPSAVLFSIILSYISYKYYERKFVKVGNRISKKLK